MMYLRRLFICDGAMNPLIVIPARYRSSRFPGKPLALIQGEPMIVHVWRRCVESLSLDRVCVATDDERIRQVCTSYGARVVMTNPECLTGTDRVEEVSRYIDADLYVNVQGDEPLIRVDDIQAVIAAASQFPNEVINAMCSITNESDYRSLTVPKVVCRPDNRLLYMSRSPIPGNKYGMLQQASKQVCIYAFPPVSLRDFVSVGVKTYLEGIEDIEILRFLELGYEIRMVEVSDSSVAVDTPQDLERVKSIIGSS